MRLLCIHGSAINSSIFQAKTTRLRSLLPPEYVYIWMDGDFHVPAQKELTEVYPGPYLSHLGDFTTRGAATAVAKVEHFIQSHGPFDGFMGICEGASLGATVILKHQEENPTLPSPFKFAIFMNGWLPFSWTSDLGHDVTNVLLSDKPLDTNVEFWQNAGPSSKMQLEPLQKVAKHAMFDINPEVELKWRATLDTVLGKDNDHLRPRCFHPDLYDGRLELATAHLWGERDIFDPHSREFFRLCDPEVATFHQHKGGHDVPQSWDDNHKFSEMIQKTALKSQFAI